MIKKEGIKGDGAGKRGEIVKAGNNFVIGRDRREEQQVVGEPGRVPGIQKRFLDSYHTGGE
jgi:hypothetical protein